MPSPPTFISMRPQLYDDKFSSDPARLTLEHAQVRVPRYFFLVLLN